MAHPRSQSEPRRAGPNAGNPRTPRATPAPLKVAEARLRTVLEQFDAPAFILSGAGEVAVTNHAGRSALQTRGTRAELVAAIAGTATEGRTRVRLARVHGQDEYVALYDNKPALRDVLEARCTQWALTERQGATLEFVASGLTNKEIANRLGCAEVTVEAHMTKLLKKSACASRSALIASFWRPSAHAAPDTA